MSRVHEHLTQCQRDRELLVETLNDLLQHIGAIPKDLRYANPHVIVNHATEYMNHEYPWWLVLYRNNAESFGVEVIHRKEDARQNFDVSCKNFQETWLLNAKCIAKHGPPDPGGLFNSGEHDHGPDKKSEASQP